MDNTENISQEKSKVVAKVNGREIKKEDLDLQVKKMAQARQIPVPDNQTEEGKQFEEKELDHMINDILLVQDAEKQGFEPKQEEIDTHYSALANQVGGEERLKQALQAMGIKIEQLRENLADQLKIEQYLNLIKEKNEIVVTDEEIKEFYEKQVAPQNQEIKLEAVEPKIRHLLEREKLNQPLSEIIQNLRKESDITVSL